MIFLNALSNAFGSSDVPCAFATSTNRLWRSASVSGFFLGADLRGMT